MSIWYETMFDRITPVEVESSTEHFVKVKGRGGRDKRLTDWRCYFRSWDEAHRHLLKEADEELEHARARLELAETKLNTINALRRPESEDERHE